ncbi:von willebrand factor type A domain protein (macronuclear) [Tetrahymena thermophila SB210]|uniref:von willebrand factor type A domain protein n=1 Tax=Tetrahymena thermophila (strain SB210) TaxID=312017 RepID=Q241A8_TETTS|nr:von willebrand factor type A domain protein [Tetrahymena thermophila SB210]EAS02256.2 von willebrand factor type A domain protein [Tetrahymena thermophila SB210]|eukprot:XP_001022501.2 von willebrand factor type A domain protein [Tetrahymena thermophila SB210]
MEIGFKQREQTDCTDSSSNSKQETASQKRLKNFEVTDSDREDYHNLVDILFVIDTTGSMSWCFQEAKNTVKDIAEMFNKQEFDIKYALCQYRDHPPQESSFVYQHNDLQGSQSMQGILGNLQAQGGGDGPEAVMDGLYEGINKTNWRKDHDGTISKRFIFHICDAPPHGNLYGGYSSDQNWQKNGCPCGITAEMIKNQLEEKQITYNLIECGGICKMEEVFRSVFGKRFEETIHISQSQIQQQQCSFSYSSVPGSFGAFPSSIPVPLNVAASHVPKPQSMLSDGHYFIGYSLGFSGPAQMTQPVTASFSGLFSSPPQAPQQQQQQQNLYSHQVQQNLLRNLK